MHLDFLFYFFILKYKLCINGLLLLYITCRNETHEVIKYLEYCVHRLHNEDPGVHNLLLSLYAKQVDFLKSFEIIFVQCIHLDTMSAFNVCISFFFFFFLGRVFHAFPMGPVHCSRDSQTSFFSKTFIKNGSHGTIHTFKNYFATVFSVFSDIQMDPICF